MINSRSCRKGAMTSTYKASIKFQAYPSKIYTFFLTIQELYTIGGQCISLCFLKIETYVCKDLISAVD